MKTLYLVRHAKSSRDDAALPDRDRPLEPRGERDATKMGNRWSHQHERPDLILSSPATRALATAQLIAERFNYKVGNIVVDDRLYAATRDTLTAVIEGLGDTLERVMLVGHNPGLTALARHFSSEIAHMPTCALAEFRFDATSWPGIGRTRPTSVAFDSPKHLSA